MKDNLSHTAVERISQVLSLAMPEFNKNAFIQTAIYGLDELELKQRVAHIINAMHKYLPSDFEETANILLNVKVHWCSKSDENTYSNFAAWPIIDYVAAYGLNFKEISLNVLKQLTSLFSAEFAIRPFIEKYPEYCNQTFKSWILDENEHVRRLVSEATRPRLPWGLQLKGFMLDPRPNLPLLTHLKSDPSLYVRRSVANHLNDISKDNPDIVINLCKSWQDNALNQQENWVIKHATRSLVKSGNLQVLSLLGFTQEPDVDVLDLKIKTKQIQIGNDLNFELSLTSNSKQQQKLVVDFAIHFRKSNNKTAPKVFKLKTFSLQAKANIYLTKKHSFKKISTRKYYPGEHKLEIFINGQSKSTKTFDLL